MATDGRLEPAARTPGEQGLFLFTEAEVERVLALAGRSYPKVRDAS